MQSTNPTPSQLTWHGGKGPGLVPARSKLELLTLVSLTPCGCQVQALPACCHSCAFLVLWKGRMTVTHLSICATVSVTPSRNGSTRRGQHHGRIFRLDKALAVGIPAGGQDLTSHIPLMPGWVASAGASVARDVGERRIRGQIRSGT